MFKYLNYISDKFLNTPSNFAKTKSNFNFSNLIISHLVNYNNLNFEDDFYFGNLPSKLGNKNTLVILIDHIGFKKKNLKKKIKGNYIILSSNLGTLNEIKLHFKIILNFFLKKFKMKNLPLAIFNERIVIQILDILSILKIKNIFLTFEGNQFESSIIDRIRKKKYKIKIFGYQFGILKKKQEIYFSKLKKNFYPDLIFTINDYNKKILNHLFKNSLSIKNVGFLRKRKKIIFLKRKISKKTKKILVMPEGVLNEIDLLYTFCKNNLFDDIVYTFRLHPIFQNNYFINKFFDNFNDKIKLSRNSLVFDFSNNDYILYRGTAGVIDAVNHKLIPIYLKKVSEITIDPFYKINNYHVVNFNKKFKFFFDTLDKNKAKKERKLFYLFAKKYFNKPNINLIKKIL